MNRDEFLNDPDVIGFVRWAAGTLPNIQVNLNITRHGTGNADGALGPGVTGVFEGLDQIVNAYHWRAVWNNAAGDMMVSDDWYSSRGALNEMRAWIQEELNQASHEGVLSAATAIIEWGGDRSHRRNPPAGALPFLEALQDLPEYLICARETLRLDVADTNNLHQVLEMNSMLTKVHSLVANDGLPIYDSRVAASIGALVELYRQAVAQHRPCPRIPETLRFRSVDRNNRRRVLGLANNYQQNNVVDPGVIGRGRGQQQILNRANEWASAKIRLGWLLNAILSESDSRNQPIFNEGTPFNDSVPAKMHALEAGLFMIGYDVSCLQ